MIRFSIGGEYLDLPADFSLQFQKKNVFFAFDKMECERSTSFDIPATPQNDRLFSLSKWIAAPGTGMRRRFNAQMQSGLVVKDGYLYIDAYSGGKYKAVFITGELLGLKRIRDLGNIDESGIFNNYPDTVPAIISTTQAVSPRNAANTLWENVRYHIPIAEGVNLHPSINVAQMLAAMGVTDRDHVVDNLRLRWIPKKPEPIQEEYAYYYVNWINKAYGSYQPVGGYPQTVSDLEIALPPYIPQVFIEDAFIGGGRAIVKYLNGSTWYNGYIMERQTKYKTYFEFPGNTPNDCFLGYFTPGSEPSGGYSNLSDFHFLGDWSFDENGNETGTPLAGRNIEIPADTYFVVIRKSWYVNGSGWNISTPDFHLDYSTLLFYDWGSNPPAVWRLKDNLPGCTAIDFLKAVAAMTGTVLYYTEEEGVVLDWLILDGARLDLTGKVISKSDVNRKFADYGQHNYVDFAPDDTQYAYEIDRTDYPIDNANLESSKVLQTLPAGNGAIYEDNGDYKTLFVREEPGADIFGYYDEREPLWLCRVKMQKNDDIQSLCDASTSVTIKARLSLLEYEQIQPRTRIYYEGVLYVWTEAQYSKDVVTLKLSKISA